VERDFIPPDPRGEPSDRHPTVNQSDASASGLWAILGWAARESSGAYLPHRALYAKKAVGRRRLWAKIVFLLFFYAEHSFDDFYLVF
jgi:hypothetical protein